VVGPVLALVMAMTGRRAVLDELAGEGAAAGGPGMSTDVPSTAAPRVVPTVP